MRACLENARNNGRRRLKAARVLTRGDGAVDPPHLAVHLRRDASGGGLTEDERQCVLGPALSEVCTGGRLSQGQCGWEGDRRRTRSEERRRKAISSGQNLTASNPWSSPAPRRVAHGLCVAERVAGRRSRLGMAAVAGHDVVGGGETKRAWKETSKNTCADSPRHAPLTSRSKSPSSSCSLRKSIVSACSRVVASAESWQKS